MDKVTGNYLTQPNKDFPLDCETMDYIAKNAAMVEILGNIGGDKVVISGCQISNGGVNRSEGYVFLRTVDYPNGEILRWEGGVSEYMYVKKEDVSVVADGYNYPKAYTRRSLAPGVGAEKYYWGDFSYLSSNVELAAKINHLQKQLEEIVGEPLGIVKMWAGRSIPNGYLLCDGGEYSRTNDEYKGLYEAIGDTFNNAKSSNGTSYVTDSDKFRVPDLRGRFIVGYHSTDEEYNIYGKSGGEKEHLLTPEETALVEHGHDATCEEAGKHNHTTGVEALGNEYGGGQLVHNNRTYPTGVNNSYYDVNTSSGGVHVHNISISKSGGSDALETHENRPPYYVLAYIIKYK